MPVMERERIAEEGDADGQQLREPLVRLDAVRAGAVSDGDEQRHEERGVARGGRRARAREDGHRERARGERTRGGQGERERGHRRVRSRAEQLVDLVHEVREQRGHRRPNQLRRAEDQVRQHSRRLLLSSNGGHRPGVLLELEHQLHMRSNDRHSHSSHSTFYARITLYEYCFVHTFYTAYAEE